MSIYDRATVGGGVIYRCRVFTTEADETGGLRAALGEREVILSVIKGTTVVLKNKWNPGGVARVQGCEMPRCLMGKVFTQNP